MARIRTVKPEFWGHPKTARVSRDARLLFIGLLNESDDEGRQLASARRLAGTLFPHDEDVSTGHIKRWLDELENVGLVRRYEVEGTAYLLICGFSDHQRVNRPSPSRLPGPHEPSVSFHAGLSEVSPPDLGSGSRNLDLGSGSIAPDETAREEVEIVPARDHLWDALMDACGIDRASITDGARGAYNKALKELRNVEASPDQLGPRAAMYRMRWPDTACTPSALARHWAELEPNGHNVPGRVVPKGMGALARVAAKGGES